MRAVLFILVILSLSGCNRMDSITRFGEENKMDKQYYLYPSTLRMVNLEQNQDYYELVEGFKKGQFYSISYTPENSELVNKLKVDMVSEGYEEAMLYKSRDSDVIVYLWERKVPKIAAIIESDSTLSIIQIEGLINVAKIPEFMEYFNSTEYLDVMNVINFKPNKHHSEQNSQD